MATASEDPDGISPDRSPPQLHRVEPSNRHSTRTCSEPASLCYNEPTTSTNTTKLASPSSSPPTRDSKPAGTPSKNSTVSTKPTTVMAPSKLSTGSPTSTSPARLPEFHHVVDTIIAWGDEILAWHSAGRPLQRPNRRNQQPPPSPTPRRPRLHQPRQLRRPRTPRDMITPPNPADSHPTDSRRANNFAARGLLVT